MRKYLCICFVIIASGMRINAQESAGGIPYSIIVSTTFSNSASYKTINNSINTYSLPYFDNQNLKNYADSISSIDPKNDKYVGKVIKQKFDIKALGTYDLVDSIKIYRYTFESSTAEALGFYFSKFNLPDGAALYLYNEDKTLFRGGFNSDNNPPDQERQIKFGIIPFPGQKVIMEYNEPLNTEFNGEVEVCHVVHVFDYPNTNPLQNTTSSDKCLINVKCPEGFGWGKEINSVVQITYEDASGNWQSVSSGAMINTTNNSEEPYLLTAGHTLENGGFIFDLNTFLFSFNYNAENCSDADFITPPSIQSTYGCTKKSSRIDALFDYALLELNADKNTLRSYNVCYSGWDRGSSVNGNNSNSPFTLIHHPLGGEKKINLTLSVQSTEWLNNFTDPNANFYRMIWNKGMTYAGSSGSPLFDISHRIVGIHSGSSTSSLCENGVYNNEPAWSAKFGKSWNDGGFGFWLDPNVSGLQTVNSFCPPENTGGSGVNTGGTSPGGSGSTGYYNPFRINESQNILVNVCVESPIEIQFVSTSSICSASAPYVRNKKKDWCSNNSPNAYHCEKANIKLGLKCWCYFAKYFLAVAECDANLNIIGTEFSEWKYITSTCFGYPTLQRFDLRYNLPSGASIQPGKFYKVKYAWVNADGKWVEWNKFIFTYSNNVTISNQTVNTTSNEIIGKNITLQNVTVNPTANPTVIANDRIIIRPQSVLKSGIYKIGPTDCSNLYNRMGSPGDTVTEENTSTAAHYSNYNNVSYNYNREAGNKPSEEIRQAETVADDIIIYPQPGRDEISISFKSTITETINIELYDLSMKRIANVLDPVKLEEGNYSFNYNTSSLATGIYFLKISRNENIHIKKLIVIHE